MALILAIENHAQLPDGGPTSIQISGRRGIDIGRDQHLDWTLPDPDRVISGKHCEIRYYDGSFWLHDLSRNGTFVNGNDRRLHEPHRLRNGDRIEIGNYIIGVRIDGQETESPPLSLPQAATPSIENIWDDTTDAPPPISPNDLRAHPAGAGGPRPDFLDWVVDMPEVTPDEPAFRLAGQSPPNLPSLDVPSSSRGELPALTERQTGKSSDRYGLSAPDYGDSDPSATSVWRGEPAQSPAQRAMDWDGTDRNEQRQAPAGSRAPASLGDRELLRRLARGAGIPPEILAGRDAGDVAEELGLLMRVVVENVKQLLIARAESRRMVRGSKQTMIQAFDNNPIKFCPTPEDALRIMLGPRTEGYLDTEQALRQSFADLKSHQLATFLAMQKAVELMMAPFDPKAIDEATTHRGLIGSRKAALWDTYLSQWEAVLAGHDNGFIDAFVSYFSQYYQRGDRDS